MKDNVYKADGRLDLAVGIFSALFNDLDFGGGEVEAGVNVLVEGGFEADDFAGVLVVGGALGVEPFFPFVAGLEGDVVFEDLLNFAAEGRKVEGPPGGEFLVKGGVGRAEVGENATAGTAMQGVAGVGLFGD